MSFSVASKTSMCITQLLEVRISDPEISDVLYSLPLLVFCCFTLGLRFCCFLLRIRAELRSIGVPLSLYKFLFGVVGIRPLRSGADLGDCVGAPLLRAWPGPDCAHSQCRPSAGKYDQVFIGATAEAHPMLSIQLDLKDKFRFVTITLFQLVSLVGFAHTRFPNSKTAALNHRWCIR